LVTCVSGGVWDVVVDLRTDSPSYLCWHAEIISSENKRAMLIPEGCAHGFQTIQNDVSLVYMHSQQYSPEAERGLNPLDPIIDIAWPLPIVKISERDKSFPYLTSTGIKIDFGF